MNTSNTKSLVMQAFHELGITDGSREGSISPTHAKAMAFEVLLEQHGETLFHAVQESIERWEELEEIEQIENDGNWPPSDGFIYEVKSMLANFYKANAAFFDEMSRRVFCG